MTKRYLAPSSAGLRHPTDAKKENDQIVNPPRYLEIGGLDKSSRTAPSVSKGGTRTNIFGVKKPGSGSAR